jgi:hypothetical protein
VLSRLLFSVVLMFICLLFLVVSLGQFAVDLHVSSGHAIIFISQFLLNMWFTACSSFVPVRPAISSRYMLSFISSTCACLSSILGWHLVLYLCTLDVCTCAPISLVLVLLYLWYLCTPM